MAAVTRVGYETRSGKCASQQPKELSAFIDLLRENGVSSYLEIGARDGDTFYEVMKSLPKGAKGLAVDLPTGAWASSHSEQHLDACINELRGDYDVSYILGDSQQVDISEVFDAVLIDADHRYDAVSKDWDVYRNKASIIAFHDIDPKADGTSCGKYEVGVRKLWDEIKSDYRHVELIMCDDNRPMGIGVLFMAVD